MPPPGQWAAFPPPGTQPLPVAQPRHAPPRGRVPGWIWPVVAVLALVVGVVGGAVGGVAYEHFRTDNVGTVSSGLAGVDTVNAPPLAAENGSVAAVAQALLPSTVQIS